MKNRDKYETFESIRKAFTEFCRGRSSKCYDCQSGFGRTPRLAGCVLCYEMWKDSDTEAEEAEAREARAAEERENAAMREFEAKYPGLYYAVSKHLSEDTPVGECWFSVRIINILNKNKIDTVRQLLDIDDAVIGNLKGIGAVSKTNLLNFKESARRFLSEKSA